ncbi:MAG: potassium channel family protein [Thermoanaerobaculia bacterium]
MKFLPSTLMAALVPEDQMRRNVRALLKYLAFLVAVIALYTVLFHLIMWNVEGQRHSWISGIYWTLVTMTTLGYGDITFETDLGRAFSTVVLVSGIILLLVVLPYVFIRYFYAPWLEARIRQRAPRALPPETAGHVILTTWDSIAPGLMAKLALRGVPCFVLEPDPVRAAEMSAEGVRVVTGELDARETYERLRADRARLVVANAEDTTNTNIVLTVREVAPETPVAATAALEESIDLLELAGAAHVLALKKRLGEHLAGRVNAGHAEAHIVGSFGDLLIAEFPVHGTPFIGKDLRQIRLRETTGLNVIGIWREARLHPPQPDAILTEHCLPVVVGTRKQIETLNELLVIYDTNWNPVLVLGGGKVGRSATRALKAKGLTVHMIEKQEWLRSRIGDLPDRLFIGDAADRRLLEEAGILAAPSVLLTTNDDAMNIYLTVYCRRLTPALRIVSRITHDRNVDAIRRAGADLVLSYADLGVESILSILLDRELVVLGEGVDLHQIALPPSLVGKTLAESGIGARTGLNVLALRSPAGEVTNPRVSQRLEAGGELLMIGNNEQLERFLQVYG